MPQTLRYTLLYVREMFTLAGPPQALLMAGLLALAFRQRTGAMTAETIHGCGGAACATDDEPAPKVAATV